MCICDARPDRRASWQPRTSLRGSPALMASPTCPFRVEEKQQRQHLEEPTVRRSGEQRSPGELPHCWAPSVGGSHPRYPKGSQGAWSFAPQRGALKIRAAHRQRRGAIPSRKDPPGRGASVCRCGPEGRCSGTWYVSEKLCRRTPLPKFSPCRARPQYFLVLGCFLRHF